MVEQLYTNARTGTYKHPSRYAVAAVGIGRGARSGWVELGWRMGRSGATNGAGWDVGWVGVGQRALTSGAGVRGISSENRAGCAQRMGRIGVADGSERSNAPSLRGRGYVGSIAEIGRSARSGWVELGWRMGRSRTTNGAGWDVGWVGAEQRALTSGAGAPLFGKIDTYGWDGARLIRRDWHVWSGAAGGKQAASGGVYAANRYSVVD